MKLLRAAAALLAVFCLTSCNTQKKEVDVASSEPVSSVSGNYAVNPLTGLNDLAPSASGKRPVTVMVSNIKIALPQYGLSKADICYEVLAEGGITRIMAVFADKNNIPKTGPVRSVRDYYVDLTEGMDGILVHFGGSPKGYSVIESYGTDDVDGMTASAAFEQDAALASSKGREHSFFTSSKLLKPVIKDKKYDMKADKFTMFKFAPDNSVIKKSEGKAKHIEVPYSGYCTAEFDYDNKTGEYLKSEFGSPHMDAGAGKQISVKNVFVLKTSCTEISGDKSGRISVALNSGSGYYASQGRYIPITWEKGEHGDAFKFYDESGDELKVARGKSWISIAPLGADITFSKGDKA